MQTYPLKSITLEEAKEKQFRLVDEICKEFTGTEFLNLGDLGIIADINKPIYTQKVERILASFFHAEKAILVTGAGTGALRWGLQALIKVNGTVLVHKAPIYPTTKITLEAFNVNVIEADFNKPDEVLKQLRSVNIDVVLIQHTRQKIDDSYDLGEVIKLIKENKNIPIITDDNYAAMKSMKIGIELGADLSAFSAFKLLGPEGVGIVLGNSKEIYSIDKMNYSGGGKVQGFQAMEVLRGLVYAPVALAIQAEESEKIVVAVKNLKIKEISDVYLANAQSKVLLVEFNVNIAEQVLIEAQKLGAAPNPVGAESKYEIIPLFYRVSGTFLLENSILSKKMIRINPMRAGAATILRILEESIKRAKSCS